jgi:uncharacterized membrane protein
VYKISVLTVLHVYTTFGIVCTKTIFVQVQFPRTICGWKSALYSSSSGSYVEVVLVDILYSCVVEAVIKKEVILLLFGD